MTENIHAKINSYIEAMPSLPTSAAKVLEICNNPQTNPVDLNRVISLDPVLMGRVMQLIHSAYYGLGQQRISLVRAIIMLGINTVKNLALSTAIMRNLSVSKKNEGLDMEGFWRHSLCVGVTAKLIAKHRGVDPKLLEEYFTAGLLHDIGKIPLNAVLPQEYMFAVSTADREHLPLFCAEANVLGIDHCAAGAMIARAWKLEGAAGEVIMNHHHYAEYSGDHKDVLYTVAAANYFSVLNETGFAGDRCPDESAGMIFEEFGSGDISRDIRKNVNDEIEKAKIFLTI